MTFVLGRRRVTVTPQAARLVRDFSLQTSVAFDEVRKRIRRAAAAAELVAESPSSAITEVEITTEGQREELFDVLAAMEKQKSPLEDNLGELKEAASKPLEF
jgi:hypothetical protein